jgi:hypothetical protein
LRLNNQSQLYGMTNMNTIKTAMIGAIATKIANRKN